MLSGNQQNFHNKDDKLLAKVTRDLERFKQPFFILVDAVQEKLHELEATRKMVPKFDDYHYKLMDIEYEILSELITVYNLVVDWLSDHRKYIIWRILSPYLLNVKKLPKEEAYSVMKEWLDKCDKLDRLNFNPKIKIKDGLRGASKGYFPISMEKLKEENRQLYDIVLDRLGNSK
jgi:hypothetical protein